MKNLLFLTFLLIGLGNHLVFAQNPMPTVKHPVYFDVSPPLTDLIPTATIQDSENENNEEGRYTDYPFWEPMGPDPVWQKQMGTNMVTDGLTQNFEGVGPDTWGVSDANGDISEDYYIQVVNARFKIFNRDGSSVYGPVNINTLFSTLPGGECNSGDPIVLYDEVADRWLISQFSTCQPTQYMHIAVSATSDPLGSYYRWAYSWGTVLPDYPKFGVWRDSYLMALNCGADDVAAFNRTQMIAGNASPAMVSFDNPWRPASGLHAIQPLDNDGTLAPAGSPALFITINDNAWGGSDQLWIYALTVNWASPTTATFNQIQQLGVAAFDANFGSGWAHIPQPGTTQKLEVLSQVLMYRAQYRNFGTHQSIVCCHDVDVDNTPHAGIRWYELRKTGTTWSIYQQGTYAPDAHNRWMGSISMNGSGEIALGYSVSSSTVYPSIRYTGRNASDALGTMTFAEQTIWNGTQSQTNLDRWGDYSCMSVDPLDDKTFWYTAQYAGGSYMNWHSRIASFKFDLYCTASGGCDEYIARVRIGTIDNSSTCDGYRDYSDISTDFPLNAIKTLTVNNSTNLYPTDLCGTWIDWNRDNDFNDANETITMTDSPGVGPYTASIAIPSGTTTGPVRMRIRIQYGGTLSACGAVSYGEVEDYTINLTPASTLNTWIGVTSINWNTPTNWSLGTVPTAAIDAVIPSGTPFQPTIDGISAYCKDIIIQSGAVLTQSGTSYLYVNGNFNSDAGQYIMLGLNSFLYFSGSVANSWDDDNANDTYTNVRVEKSTTTAQTTMYEDMTCSGTFEVREGVFAIDQTWTLTIANTGTSAFEVESGGKLILSDETITCAGDVNFEDGSQAAITGGTINCAKNFVVDANASYNIVNTGGTLRMNGSSTQYINDLDGGTLDLYNLVIAKSAGTCYIASANLDVNNLLSISGGVLSCNNAPTPTATYNINVGGNWSNSVGLPGFEESTGTVVFDGAAGHQICYSEAFHILEVNKASGAFRVNGGTVTCNQYNWTAGAIDVLSGTFTALDLADSGLDGGYWVNSGGTINLYQDLGQYVDLRGHLNFNGGGTINVYGGNGYSYWPFTNNASITMSGGVLDFKDNGIQINNSALSLTDNITGGIIRMSRGFVGNRADFAPTAGVFEFYGTSDYLISQSGGCTLYDVVINKSAKDGEDKGPQGPVIDERSGMILSDGGKSNTITLGSNFAITGDLDINAGTFDLANFGCTVNGITNINAATLAITQATGDLNSNTLYWNSGSNDNITAGTFHIDNWYFKDGTNAKLGTGNTAYVENLGFPEDADAEFGNLVAVLNAKQEVSDNKAFYPIRVAGNFTMETGGNWWTMGVDLIVAGNSFIQNGGNIEFVNGTDYYNTGTMDIAGTVTLSSGSVITTNGAFTFPATGILNLGSNGQFLCNYNNSSGWADLFGRIDMSGTSIFEMSLRSVSIGASFNDANMTGGTLRLGRGLSATNLNTFQLNGVQTEFIGGNTGHYVQVTNGNYLHSMNLNKPSGTLQVYDNLVVKDDMLINAGVLNANGKTINVGGDWTNSVGLSGFVESTGTVVFDGVTGHQICSSEAFHILEVNKASGAFRLNGGTVTCNQYNWTAGAIDVLSGTFTALDLADSGLDGGYWVNPGGTINLYQDLGQYVDLRGHLNFNGGGTINVYGGSGYSYWPYTNNASITMSGGVLDFKDNGILISNTGLSLTDNITGGTIRMSRGFNGNRADFTPTAGTFEFYGSSDYNITQSNGCTLYKVVINKSAKDGEDKGTQGSVIDERSGMILSDGGKSNTITLGSHFAITGDLNIIAGTLNANAQIFNIEGDWNNMVGPNGFAEGTGRVVFAGNKAQMCWGEEFYILEVNKPLQNLYNYTNASISCQIYDWTQGGIWIAGNGNFYAADLADNGIYGNWTLYGNSIELNQDASQGIDLIGNLFINEGEFIVYGGNNQSEWGKSGNATLTMQGGTLDFADQSILIEDNSPYAFTSTITGGIIRTRSFMASSPGFVPVGGTVEIYGDNNGMVTASTEAYFHNLKINTEPLPFYTNIYSCNINNDLIIEEGSVSLIFGNTMQCGNVIINSGGDLRFNSATLKMKNNGTININSGGYMALEGYEGAKSTFTGINSTDRYQFNVNAGGTIFPTYTDFENMSSNGIYIASGATVLEWQPFYNCEFRNGAAGGTLLNINNDQNLEIENAVFPSNSWGGLYNVTKSNNAGNVTFLVATGGFAGENFDNDPFNRIHWGELTYYLNLKVWLEGPFNNTDMNTNLTGLTNFPLIQPYNVYPWNYAGTESVATVPGNVVDWVLVELRDAPSAAAANSATRIARQAAFLKKDGSIVGLNGTSLLQFNNSITHQLFVVIWHRNHIEIMSAIPLVKVGETYSYDFRTDVTKAYGAGVGYKDWGAGVAVMVGADGNADGNINNLDKIGQWNPNAGKKGYLSSDFNMDSQVNNMDKNNYWWPNEDEGFNSQVPE